ncbi:PadR family transcriptional regulator [Candidatus Micrarchaeota archaeon]|nr:PadR family transcriptional regulator [Candidatus Micrarchaeota archaeon]
MEPLKTKPLKRLKQLLTFGNLWLYILSIIKKSGKAYAYMLDDEIEKGYFFRPGKVMIYLVLYKLEAEDLIKSEFEERRKYYRLTKKGEETLILAKKYFLVLGKEL